MTLTKYTIYISVVNINLKKLSQWDYLEKYTINFRCKLVSRPRAKV